MKKGCFLKTVIIITIIIASILYIFQHKFDEIFVGTGKKFVLSVFEDKWTTELKYIQENPEKDSLKSLIKIYIADIKSADEISNEETKSFFQLLENSFKDSLIDKSELSEITKLIKSINHERSKKN
ncbi:MAG TPA: hypothetical protein VI362_03130 [Ignavibacteriaceae bacterium]|nr:hypothetical protein [Ignavibacteriaceae bacterium]